MMLGWGEMKRIRIYHDLTAPEGLLDPPVFKRALRATISWVSVFLRAEVYDGVGPQFRRFSLSPVLLIHTKNGCWRPGLL
jgi:hypothetical protein